MVPQQSYSMNAITVLHNVSFATRPDSSENYTNVHIKPNPSHMVKYSVNATGATNVCINSFHLKANVLISSKTKYVSMQCKVNTGADTILLPLDLYQKLHPNATAKS